MAKRKSIKCSENITVNICNIKKGDVLILNLNDEFSSLDQYEDILCESNKLSKSLEKELGYKVPVVVLAGDMTFKTMARQELLDIIND